MNPRLDLPEPFASIPFSVVEAGHAGIGRGRLSGTDLAIPFRGARVVAGGGPHLDGSDADRALWLCRAFLPVMGRGQFFSHTTAARLWGCPVHYAEDPDVLHVSTRPPDRAPRRAGVIGHQSGGDGFVIERFGLRVADAASVFLQLAEVMTLRELVTIGDHLVLDPWVLDPRDIRPHLTLEELRARVATWRGRGRRRAVTALGLIRLGAESRPETLLRLLLGDSGCPEPEVNPELHGVRSRWTHRADLVYRARRVVVEYDGDQHRTSTRQYEHDIRRFDDFADDGWRVVRVRAHGLFVDPTGTVARVRSALDAGGTPPR